MPKIVEVPGLGNVEFPDSMSDTQITSAIETDILPKIGAAKAPVGRGGIFASAAEQFATGLTDVPGSVAGILGALGTLENPEETRAAQFSRAARPAIQKALGINPEATPTTAELGAGALGSLASFFVPGLGASRIAKAVGAEARAADLAGKVATGVQAGALGAAQQQQQMEATGKEISQEDRNKAILAGGAIGLTDLIPLQRFMGPLEAILAKVPLAKSKQASNVISKAVRRAARSATEEGAQEAFSQAAQNLVAQGIYDPSVNITDGLLANAGAGGFAGGTMDVVLQLLAGRKGAKMAKVRGQLEGTLGREGQAGGEEGIRADAQEGLAQIRQANPIGNLAVKRELSVDEKTGDTTELFHVIGEDEKPIASFRSADAAVQAGQQYQKDTGGLAKFNTPTVGEMAARSAIPEPTAEEKAAGEKTAEVLKQEGAFEPSPAATTTTPEGRAATEAVTSELSSETGVPPTEMPAPVARKKGRIRAIQERAVQTLPPAETPPPAPFEGLAAPEQPFPRPPERMTPERELEMRAAGLSDTDLLAAGLGQPNQFSVPPTTPQAPQAERGAVLPPPTPPVAPAPPRNLTLDVVRNALPKDQNGNPDMGVLLDAITAVKKGKPVPFSQLTEAQKLTVARKVAPNLFPPKGKKPRVITPTDPNLLPYTPRTAVLFRPSENTAEGRAAAKVFDERMGKVVEEVNKALAPIGLKNVRVQFQQFLKGKTKDGRQIFPQGYVNSAGDVIFLSINTFDPNLTAEQNAQKVVEIAHHEIIHSIMNLGLYKPGEIKSLFDAVQRVKYPGTEFTYFDRAYATYGGVYTNEDGSPNMEMVVEEGVAEMFRDWNAGRLKLVGTPKGLFQRMLEFLKRLFTGFKNARKDAGVDEIFRAIKSGEFGTREAKPTPAGGEQKFSITTDDFQSSPWGRIFAGPQVSNALRDAADERSRRTIVAMTPKEYLDAATHGLRNPGQEKVYAENIGRGMSLDQLPMLMVKTSKSGDSLEVVGHEGRHRVKALENLGYNLIPVQISHENYRWGEEEVPPPETMIGQPPMRNTIKTPDSIFFPRRDGKEMAQSLINASPLASRISVGLAPDQRQISNLAKAAIKNKSLYKEASAERKRTMLSNEEKKQVYLFSKEIANVATAAGADFAYAAPGVGVFGGEESEASSAFEAITTPEKEAEVANAVLIKVFNDAKVHTQRSAFVARSLPSEQRNEDYARPGVTIFFKPRSFGGRTGQTIEEVKEVINSLPGTDVLGGFTVIGSDAGFGTPEGDFQALRFIWIPEYAGVSVEELASNWKSVVGTLNNIAEYVKANDIGSAKVEHYDLAIGYEDNYDSQINAAEQLRAGRDAASLGGAGPWRRSVGSSVASRTGVTAEQLQGYRSRGELQSGEKKFSVAPPVNSEEFQRWFAGSKAVNENGSPRVFYHGRPKPLRQGEFRRAASGALPGEEGPYFFSPSKRFAGDYALTDLTKGGTGKATTQGTMYPVYLSTKKPWDFDNEADVRSLFNEIKRIRPEGFSMAEMFGQRNADVMAKDEATRMSENRGFLAKLRRGNWRAMENPIIQRALRDLGYDGFHLVEGGVKNLAVYSPVQVKSIFNQFQPGTAESRKLSIAPTKESVAEVQIRAAKKTADEIAIRVTRPGANIDDLASAANIAVKDAISKLSIAPTYTPLPPMLEAANDTLFAKDTTPRTLGEKLMSMFGGLGTAADRAYTLDNLRVQFVHKEAQFEKLQRQAYLQGLLPQFEQNFASYGTVASMDMQSRASHYTVEVMKSGAPVIKMIDPRTGKPVLPGQGGDINSMYLEVDEDPENAPTKVFDILLNSGPNNTDLSKAFRTLAVARVSQQRIKEGKPVRPEITPAFIAAAEQLAVQYPQLNDAFTRYQNFNKKLMKAALDSGTIDVAGYHRFTDEMSYYSMYAQFEEEPIVPGTTGALGSAIKIREYTGGGNGKLLADPIAAMMYNVAFWNNAILKNIASQKALRVGLATGMMERLPTITLPNGNRSIQQPDVSRGFVDKVFYTNIDGVSVPFATKDPLLAVGLMSSPSADLGGILKYMGLPTSFLREMVTRDPGFMIANLLRDAVSTWVLAGSGAKPQDTFRGLKSALMKSGSYQSLRNFAVIGSFDEAQKSPEKFVAGLRQKLIKRQGITDVTESLKWAWDGLEKLSEASDAATRIAVYEAAKKSGADDFTAAYRALSIMNFSRSGNSAGLRVYTKLVPFLNARIQGFDVLYQGIKAGVGVISGAEQTQFEKQRGAAVLYRGMGLAAAAMALALLNSDDEDYKQLPQYIKDANILVPIGGGKFLSIPKPFEAGFLFMTVPTTLYDISAGNRSLRSGLNLFYGQFSNTFGFNPTPQVALPIYENITNSDFYTGLPLISAGQEKLDPSLQYNASTSYVARGIGKALKYTPLGYNIDTGRFEGVSPILIDNLISGYGGPIASYIGMALGGITSAFGSDGEGLPVAGSNLPVIRRFFVDAQDKQPQAAADAYELYQQVDKVTRTVARLKKMGDVEALKEYRAENIDILRAGTQVRKMADNLNNLRAQLRRLEADKTMSGEQKLAKMRELRSREIALTKRINEINQKLGR